MEIKICITVLQMVARNRDCSSSVLLRYLRFHSAIQTYSKFPFFGIVFDLKYPLYFNFFCFHVIFERINNVECM